MPIDALRESVDIAAAVSVLVSVLTQIAREMLVSSSTPAGHHRDRLLVGAATQ